MRIVSDLISVYIFVLIVRGLLSFMVTPSQGGALGEVNHVLIVITEPLLVPIRRVVGVHRVGASAIDWSPLILVVLLLIIRGFL